MWPKAAGRPKIIEEVNIGVQELRDIVSVGQIEVQIEFFLDLAVQRLNNGIIRGSSPSRHGTKYVIIMVSLAKSP